jgi:hypothetical protein
MISKLNMWYGIGKFSLGVTTFFLKAPWSKISCQNYNQEFLGLLLGSPKVFCHFDATPPLITNYIIGKEVVVHVKI